MWTEESIFIFDENGDSQAFRYHDRNGGIVDYIVRRITASRNPAFAGSRPLPRPFLYFAVETNGAPLSGAMSLDAVTAYVRGKQARERRICVHCGKDETAHCDGYCQAPEAGQPVAYLPQEEHDRKTNYGAF